MNWLVLCLLAGIAVGMIGRDLTVTITAAAITIGLLLGSALALVL